MKLTAKNVIELLDKCGSETGDISIMGIAHQFCFDSQKLNEHKSEIKELLYQLPDTFLKDTGGGWSFLMACTDREGKQWGEHIHMEALFALGEACELCKSMFPRELWKALPGGVPYYIIY